jgi:hypothetical protein
MDRKRRKQLEKRRDGLKEQKERHIQKLKEFKGKNYTIPDYWTKEIERIGSEIEDIEEKLNS